MANVFLSTKNVGDIVKIKENGVAVNYIIVHKGLPSSMYDSSCDGIWVLREATHSNVVWQGERTYSNENNYENSAIKAWLNGTFLNTIDSKLRAAIKTVKIPFKKGAGNASTPVQSGSSGLSCKVFILGVYEVGLTTEQNPYFPVDGAKLSYFSDQTSRICKDSSGAVDDWWLRSPVTDGYGSAWKISTIGSHGTTPTYHDDISARPAFILPSTLLVGSDGTVSTNTLPTITSNKTGNLGTLTSGFTCKYSVNDADASDSVSVSLYLDSTKLKTFSATKGAQYTYTLAGNDWLKITNGTHTFRITATDGKDTVTSTATFTRACRKATVTLTSALPADDIIRFCSLKVKGALPMDTILKCEVTNNANDASPVWEDCTARVKSESTYVFKNKEAANGFAFNFRVSAERGASGIGGYITTVCGGFE